MFISPRHALRLNSEDLGILEKLVDETDKQLYQGITPGNTEVPIQIPTKTPDKVLDAFLRGYRAAGWNVDRTAKSADYIDYIFTPFTEGHG